MATRNSTRGKRPTPAARPPQQTERDAAPLPPSFSGQSSRQLTCGTTLQISGTIEQLGNDCSLLLYFVESTLDPVIDGLQDEGDPMSPRTAMDALYAAIDLVRLAKSVAEALHGAAIAAQRAVQP